jgi:hypothetical protein
MSEQTGEFERAVGIFVDTAHWVESRFRDNGDIRFGLLRSPNCV